MREAKRKPSDGRRRRRKKLDVRAPPIIKASARPVAPSAPRLLTSRGRETHPSPCARTRSRAGCRTGRPGA